MTSGCYFWVRMNRSSLDAVVQVGTQVKVIFGEEKFSAEADGVSSILEVCTAILQDPSVEKLLLEKTGLKPEQAAAQLVPSGENEATVEFHH